MPLLPSSIPDPVPLLVAYLTPCPYDSASQDILARLWPGVVFVALSSVYQQLIALYGIMGALGGLVIVIGILGQLSRRPRDPTAVPAHKGPAHGECRDSPSATPPPTGHLSPFA